MNRIHTPSPSRRVAVLSVVALSVALALQAPVLAGEPPGPARFAFEQAAQPVADALRAIARQTGSSVLFDPGVVSGKTARPVSGRLSVQEAVTKALDGTGLVCEVMPDGALVVRASPAWSAPPSKAPASGAQQSSALAGAVAAAHGSAAPGRQQAVASSTSDAASSALAPEGAQRVEVTGSRLKQIHAEGPVPVNVYSRADLERSGQPSIERFLAGLNETSVSQGEGTFGPMSGQASVQLRGLPLGSTLVLLNGRRLQAVGSSSGNFFNLGLIPLAAVERIEVLPVGSSAVYGGDALAGVVNVILKKSLDGPTLDVRLGAGRGIGDRSVSLATGRRDEEGAFLVLGTYNRSTPLTMAERGFFADADYRRLGGPDARSRLCSPGTVSSTTSANLPGLGAPMAAIPSAGSQPLTPASFALGAGQANLCNSMASGRGYALVYGDESLGLHAAAERRLSERWTVFGELTVTEDRLAASQGGLQLNNVLVPAGNPFNPFGVPVRVTTRLGLENGTEGLSRTTRFSRAVAGVRGELSDGWDLEVSVSTSRDDGQRLQLNNAVNTAARTAALAATSPDQALNPFSTGLAASEMVLRGIWTDAVRDNHGRKDLASAFLRGTVLELPAGPLEAIAGAEFGRDRYATSATGSVSDGSRTASALFGEFRMPVARSVASDGRPWTWASVTLAGRRDHYSDFGSATTSQAGIELRPARNWLLRSAVASSFKPPTLLQTGLEDIRLSTDVFGLTDPARGGQAVTGGEVLRATNPDLRPERGRAWSAGALWEPADLAGSRVGLSAWRVRIDGLIALLWPQVTLDNEALFPGFVTRAPAAGGTPGAISRILYSEVNFGSIDTQGIDLEATHRWKSSFGRWTASASATRTNRYDVVIAPGAAVEDRLGRRAVDYWAPRWKGRLAMGLDTGAWGVGLTSRYLGRYLDAGTSQRELGNYWVHDLSGQVDLKAMGVGAGSFKAAMLTLSVANLANRQPQFVETSPFYDLTQADWRGRYASLRLSVGW